MTNRGKHTILSHIMFTSVAAIISMFEGVIAVLNATMNKILFLDGTVSIIGLIITQKYVLYLIISDHTAGLLD